MLLHPLPDLWGGAIIPRRLAQYGARNRVPSLGDPARPYRAPTAVLTGRQSEVRDELTRVGKPREVANLSNDGRSHDRTDAFESLQCRQQRRPV